MIILLTADSTCKKDSPAGSALLPLKLGNEWIYRDSTVEDGNLISTTNDTLRIEKTSSFENSPTYIFSDGKEILQRGDTLFQIVSQRGGYKFATKLFYLSETESSFNYAYGGDVMMQRTVSRLPGCPKNEWGASRCYYVKDGCQGEMTFAVGVGILREKTTQCFSPAKNYSIKTLISVHFSK